MRVRPKFNCEWLGHLHVDGQHFGHHTDRRFHRDHRRFGVFEPQHDGELFHYRATRSFRHVLIIAAATWLWMGGRKRQRAGGSFLARCSVAPTSSRGRTRPHGPGTFCCRDGLGWWQQQRQRRKGRRNAGGQLHHLCDGNQCFPATVAHWHRNHHGAVAASESLNRRPLLCPFSAWQTSKSSISKGMTSLSESISLRSRTSSHSFCRSR